MGSGASFVSPMHFCNPYSCKITLVCPATASLFSPFTVHGLFIPIPSAAAELVACSTNAGVAPALSFPCLFSVVPAWNLDPWK